MREAKKRDAFSAESALAGYVHWYDAGQRKIACGTQVSSEKSYINSSLYRHAKSAGITCPQCKLLAGLR